MQKIKFKNTMVNNIKLARLYFDYIVESEGSSKIRFVDFVEYINIFKKNPKLLAK